MSDDWVIRVLKEGNEVKVYANPSYSEDVIMNILITTIFHQAQSLTTIGNLEKYISDKIHNMIEQNSIKTYLH